MKNKKITIYELIGLIKDNKAPKKIKYNGKEYYYNFGDYYSVKDINLFNNIELKLKSVRELLDVTIEILPKENDEWKDIGELMEFKEVRDYGLLHIQQNRLAINKLIKNQKYLKEKIDKCDREN